MWVWVLIDDQRGGYQFVGLYGTKDAVLEAVKTEPFLIQEVYIAWVGFHAFLAEVH